MGFFYGVAAGATWLEFVKKPHFEFCPFSLTSKFKGLMNLKIGSLGLLITHSILDF
jgi:hypothetical protein